MSESREAILDRVVAALQASPIAPTSAFPVAEPFPSRSDDLVPHALSALERSGVTFEVADSPVAARLKLVAELQELGITSLLAWDDSQLPVPGLLDALAVLGISAITPAARLDLRRSRVQDLAQRQAALASVDSIDLGLASADAACADTGTLILCSGPGRSHLVTQLPRRLIILLPSNRIVPSLGHWLAAQPAGPSSTALLTGPGYAYDVELTPTVGVHGPRQLHLILIQHS
jgi:L-lactate dehydrogenase complex protein LldG